MKTAGRIFTNSIFFAHIILIIAPMSIVMGSLRSTRAETDGFCKTHTGT